jgi:MATE family multidrug resistance protein
MANQDRGRRTEAAGRSEAHPFVAFPNRTLVRLSFPVLLSLIAEPLTGLVDTAFVSRLGAADLASLGVGAITLSSIFWIFNFLGVGSQTETAQATGRGDFEAARSLMTTALLLGAGLGVLAAAIGWPLAEAASVAMGAGGELLDGSATYIRIRLLGAPAIMATIVAFGILRGVQDMQSPLRIAIGVNLINIVLDPLLIFGVGSLPGFGIGGAATATVIAQWVGAIWCLSALRTRIGGFASPESRFLNRLLRIGGDLFVRTGLLSLFLLLATRSATLIGPDGGAAHQAIRQVWVFTALFLDSFAISGQSLIGYFFGAGDVPLARRVAAYVCVWSFGTGVILGIVMWIGAGLAEVLLVPPAASHLFQSAWWLAAVTQPLNALSFGTDGVHWGTGDYGFLRNAMIVSTGVGAGLLMTIDVTGPDALQSIWLVTLVWIVVRAVLGVIRIWPGVGKAPLVKR